MLDEATNFKLLRGDDIKIDSHIVIKSFDLSHIVDIITYDNYNNYLSYIAYTPYELRAKLHEMGILHIDITHWDWFVDIFTSKNEMIAEAIKTFLSIDINNYIGLMIDGKKVLMSKDNSHEIDELKFNYMIKIIRDMNGLSSDNKEPKFGNRLTAEYDVERHVRRIKKGRLGSDVTLKSIISSLCWNSNSITIANVWDLTLYQIYDAVDRKTKKERYDNIMFGIYTGNIKSETINFNKENWLSK